jgi:predicted dehydrogenase
LGDQKIIEISSSQTLFAEIASSIAENIDTGNDHPLSAQHGIESYRVLDAMVRSANTGKRIQLK